MTYSAMDKWVDDIKLIMTIARRQATHEMNVLMLSTYWQLGQSIVENEQNGELKAQYGKSVLAELSKRLTKELGRGYSRSNLYNMRDFYTTYPAFKITLESLSWSHYLELKNVDDSDARAFYEHECVNAHWSVDELKRQIGTSLFERLLLSDGKPNKVIKAYVLIDLKMDDMKFEYAGQMNGYLNYYKTEVNDEGDNQPIGIILCKTSKGIVAEYALGGLSNQVFASTYTYYIPDKEQLVNEVRSLFEQEDEQQFANQEHTLKPGNGKGSRDPSSAQ